MRIPLYTIPLLILLATGCASKPQLRDPDLFRQGRYQEVLDRQNIKIQQRRHQRDWALAHLKSASVYLARNDLNAASDSLDHGQNIMWRFDGESEAEAFHHGEDRKIYKGDPFEKAMAAFYLGMIDYSRGRYDNAIASCKTGLLSDSGSKEIQYQSDFAPLYYLQGIAYRALGESENAKRSFSAIHTALHSRIINDVARSTVSSVIADMREDRAQYRELELASAIELVFSQIALLNSEPEALPSSLLTQAFQRVSEAIERRVFSASSKKPNPSPDWHLVSSYIGVIESRCKAKLENIREERYSKYNRFIQKKVDALSKIEDNVTIIFDMGLGPQKISAGSRGERAIISSQPYIEKRAEISINGVTYDSIPLEDLYFQASTRGGRKMDFILKDRAVYKDTSDAIGSYLAVTSIYTLPIAALIYIVSSGTDAKADTRLWDILPGEIHALSLRLNPGAYDIDVRFLDALGGEVPSMRQHLHNFEVSSDKPTIWYIRSKLKN